MSIRLASFDVFDCAVMRDALFPTEMFHGLARRILALSGLAAPLARSSADDFVQWRVHAETLARRNSAHEEVTLDEIWAELFAMLGCAGDPRFAEAELAEEALRMRPVITTRQRMAQARREYGKAVLISDSYLPRAFLERELRAHGLLVEGDSLYVSSELRKTKASGRLFRHVLEAEDVAPSQLLHYGDNRISDVRVPREIGIRASRVSVPDLTENEQALLAAPLGGKRSLRELAGASRHFRLTRERDPGTPDATELAGAFLGPFCGLFAAWVLASAQRSGVRRLYFCARDCQTVWRAARILAPRFGGIECSYLLVSRQALLLPSIRDVRREELHWLRRPFERPLVDRVLAKLEIDPARHAGILRDCGIRAASGRLLDDEGWEGLWTTLESPPLRELIESNAARRRAAAAAYFRAQGLLDCDRAGLVDIGWFLTLQAAIRRILGDAGHTPEIEGFYLQLNQARTAPALAGCARALFHEPAPDMQGLARQVSLGHLAHFLEHVVGLADHPRLQAYELDPAGRPRPVFAAPAAGPDEACAALAAQRAVEEYVAAYQDRLVSWAASEEDLPAILQRTVEAFFERAGMASISCLMHLSVTADQNDHDSTPLARALAWSDALGIKSWMGRGSGFPDALQPWPRAKRELTPPLRFAAYRCARRVENIGARAWRKAFGRT